MKTKPRSWRTSELRYVKEMFHQMDYQQIADNMNRPVCTAVRMANAQGLRRFNSRSEFLDFLKNNYKDMTHKEIANKYGYSAHTVRQYCSDMGLIKRVVNSRHNSKMNQAAINY